MYIVAYTQILRNCKASALLIAPENSYNDKIRCGYHYRKCLQYNTLFDCTVDNKQLCTVHDVRFLVLICFSLQRFHDLNLKGML